MNIYLQALIGLIAVFAVGFVFYGVIFKEALKDSSPAPTPSHLGMAVVGVYLVAYFFIQLFGHTYFADTTSIQKGLYLGLLTGVAFFVIPLFTDSSFLKPKSEALYALLFNWLVSFIVLGLVVGFLNR